MSENIKKPNRRSLAVHTAAGMILLAVLVAAVSIVFASLRLTGRQRADAAATPDPAQTAAPTPEAHETGGETPDPADSPVPEPTPRPGESYMPTAIKVDGAVVAVLASRQAAEEVLSRTIAHFEKLCSGPVVSEFVNDVQLADLPASRPMIFDDVLELFTGKTSPVSVRSHYTVTDIEVIANSTEVTESAEFYAGTRFVLAYGRTGKRMYVREYAFLNGEAEPPRILEEALLMEPVDEQIVIGTRPLPAEDISDGSYMIDVKPDGAPRFTPPVNGEVGRHFGIFGGALHRGTDLECESGADIRAACSGIVIAVIERGALGMTVDIDHGGGFVTRCAMLASASVAVGDSVSSGSRIGTAGGSGLHFELLYNGQPLNPAAFIDFGGSWY